MSLMDQIALLSHHQICTQSLSPSCGKDPLKVGVLRRLAKAFLARLAATEALVRIWHPCYLENKVVEIC